MTPRALEESIVEVLRSSRNTLGVSRARCYAMQPDGSYRLAASYGFVSRFGPEERIDSAHPLIEWVSHHRRPSFVNSPHDAGRLGEVMERERYARSLTAPVYQDSRLVGVVELQDKLGGGPFGWDDIGRVQPAIQRIEEVFGRFDAASVAGPEPLAPEDREALFLDPRPRSQELPAPPDLFSDRPPASIKAPGSPAGPSASADAPGWEDSPETLRREALVIQGFVRALLVNPDLEAVVFSLWSPQKGELSVGARRSFSASAREMLTRSLEDALRSAVPTLPIPSQTVFQDEFPLGPPEGEIAELAGVQTSVLYTGPRTLLFSLVFSRPPSASREAVLKETHRLVRAAVLQVRGAERYRHSYRSLVQFLIEPDRRPFPQLKAHSLAVGALCRRFAASLRLAGETVEQFTVAGLLHDVGLKDLEIPYERIAGRRALDLQELTQVRQHAVVGASLLSRVEFPYAVAPLVRHHHERFDGGGYPDRLAGERIPLGSRVIGICEAFDAMVAAHSYRAPISEQAALEIILSKGGTQFDPELARQFADLLRDGSSAHEESFPRVGP